MHVHTIDSDPTPAGFQQDLHEIDLIHVSREHKRRDAFHGALRGVECEQGNIRVLDERRKCIVAIQVRVRDQVWVVVRDVRFRIIPADIIRSIVRTAYQAERRRDDLV